MKRIIITSILGIFFSISLFAQQNVAINTTGAAPDASAILDVGSINKGLLIPRMTQAQRNAIANPATALTIYQTDNTPGYYYYDGTQWLPLTGTDDQNLTGASLTGTTLQIDIENGTSTSVNLAALQDGTGTDDQNIQGCGLSGNILTIGIENGTSQTVDLSSLGGSGSDNDWQIDGNNIYTGHGGSYPSGNVGIGTINPSDRLVITGTTETTTRVKIGYYGSYNNIESGRLVFDEDVNAAGICGFEFQHDGNTNKLHLNAGCTGMNTYMTWLRTGNVGVGTDSPTAQFHTTGSLRFEGAGTPAIGRVLTSDANGNATWQDPSSGGDDGDWELSGNNVLTGHGGLYPSGNVGIGTATPTKDLHVKQKTTSSGTAGIILEHSTSGNTWSLYHANTENLWFQYNGALSAWIDYTSGVWNTSDRRLKKDFTPLETCLEKVMQLEALEYTFIRSKNNRRDIGFISQDVEKLFPQLVQEQDGYFFMNYSLFSVIAIKAVQEQQTIIEKQQQEIDDLRKEIDEIKKIIDK